MNWVELVAGVLNVMILVLALCCAYWFGIHDGRDQIIAINSSGDNVGFPMGTPITLFGGPYDGVMINYYGVKEIRIYDMSPGEQVPVVYLLERGRAVASFERRNNDSTG